MNKRLLAKASAIAVAAAIAAPSTAMAQTAVDVLRDEIFVIATKKKDAENVQDVPLAITAYGDEQLDALKVRDIGSLSYAMPNVSLEDIGTSRGGANFAIRGLGVNSSIPSIDPAVGTFVDGVYLGQNAGVVLDIFDLESVEVLRGPQGILFGRNVTGGAVLINTKKPNLKEFETSMKVAAESGLRGTGMNYYLMGSVSGPVIEDTLAIKLSAYYNNDRGYHKRYLGGPNLPTIAANSPLGALAGLIAQARPDEFVNHGEAETWIVRPQLLWAPTDSVEVLLRYEHFESDGDGPAAQNHSGFVQPPFDVGTMTTPAPIPLSNFLFSAPKDSFIFSIDERGGYTQTVDAITAQIDIDVDFGDGTITNIFGWRDTAGTSNGDIDGTPFHLFHSSAANDFKQISNELRYSGRFMDKLDATVGFYYYSADHVYQENRNILGGFRTLFGGGLQDSRNYGIFGQLDYDLTDNLTLLAGGRYTNEKKSVVLSNISLNPAPCSVDAGTCIVHFTEENSWKNFTPKVGLRYSASDDLNLYAHWTQGVRSGGYNFRNTSVVFPIEGFDEETVNTFELGMKAQPADGRVRLNAAVFYSDISDMQREINLADAFAGVVQLIRNTADAHIFGVEVEGQFAITDNFLLQGNVGHLSGTYDTVLFDLNSDGIVNATDLDLEIPRLAPWTYGVGFVHSLDLGDTGDLTTRFNYSHRDDNPYTDNNLGILFGSDRIDATVALNLSNGASISLYGKNLLHEVTHGGETQLPTTIGGGSFAPLNKGRVVGIELQLDL